MELDETNLARGLLGLLMFLVEVIAEVLEEQALHRLDAGSLTSGQIDNLGHALLELQQAVATIKHEHDLEPVVARFRDEFDALALQLLQPFVTGDASADGDRP